MAIEQDDVIKIIKLMDESDYDELHLEMGDLKLTIVKSGTGGRSPQGAANSFAAGAKTSPGDISCVR